MGLQGRFNLEWNLGERKREGCFFGKNEDGRVFERNFKDGELHGYQKETWSYGKVDEYNYQEGKKHGY